MTKIDRIKELVEQLNYHRDLYYNESRSEISDYKYDKLFDELNLLEKETGFVLATSPTQTVGYEVKSILNKVTHNHPMLSLDKTKSIDDVIKFLDGRNGVIMAKMDGLTCSLRYLNGELVSAETRGNGEIGEDILHCAKTIKNIPLKIDCLDEVIIDGEVIITYDDFEKINATLPEDQKYKHPRNLASGSIRQLDSSIAAQRNMKFIAWKAINGYSNNSFCRRLTWMSDIGFDITPASPLPKQFQSAKSIEDAIETIRDWAQQNGYPIDGCVFGYDDVAYGDSLGATGHHLRSQLAFKFYDEVYETKLLDIDWTIGKTGVLTPTAVFEPVEIDGTTVERASVHNISILTKLDLHIGDTIEVIKANQIIPQVVRNVSSDNREALGIDPKYIAIPSTCPICGGNAEIKQDNDSKVLVCTNPKCNGKLLGKFVNFVSKKGMNIDGLSEATLELLINNGCLNEFVDIYGLSAHRDKLVTLPGLGQKSVEKLLLSIENSRNVKLENFICALGIPNVGASASKTISNKFNGDYNSFIRAYRDCFEWEWIDDIGTVTAVNIDYYLDNHFDCIQLLASEMNFVVPEKSNNNSLYGMKFCITGSFSQPRDELKKKLEDKGAKFVSSVSKNLDILFCGDKAGSKLAKAQSLGVKVADEQKLMKLLE